MEKVLVNLYVPSISTSYDVYLPLYLSIQEIVKLLGEGLEKISARKYLSSGNELLCNIDMGMVLIDKHTLAEYHIKNGDKLMFC